MRIVTITAAAWMSGCQDWPRHAHLPDAGETTPAGKDPHAAVVVDWQTRDDDGAEQPPGTDLGLLATGDGLLILGELEGAGWDDLATPEPLVGDGGPDCARDATRAPIPGDYRADVDAWAIQVQEPGRLCVRAGIADASTGVDLLVAPVDDCGVPLPWFADPDDGEPIGFASTGPSPGWWVDVPSPGTLTIQLAAYAPNLAEALPYRLGISLRPADEAICPILPTAGAL